MDDSKPLARSARPERGIPEQSYEDHVSGVLRRAREHAEAVAAHVSGGPARLFADSVCLAAAYHDLGKLAPDNQDALAEESRNAGLPLGHADAGVAALVRELQALPTGQGLHYALAGALIRAHHAGLPNQRDLLCRNEQCRELVDGNLDAWLAEHESIFHNPCPGIADTAKGMLPAALFLRLALSCLVDADHENAGQHDAAHDNRQPGWRPPAPPPDLRAGERLALLDSYVAGLGQKYAGDPRTDLRQRIYQACREAAIPRGRASCQAPVGTGKTTAVMAHLLRMAQDHGLRRIFVVLPYTTIIDQSVDTYRKCLCFPDEDPERVVAAHHHRADFESEGSRELAMLWRAPIVVTTAVQFFETLAGNRPSRLRKLHELAGSAVFADEAHAALPAKLWPVAWTWLKALASDYNCHMVLGSGSLSRFWEHDDMVDDPSPIPDILPKDLQREAEQGEKGRVRFESLREPLALGELADWIADLPGPRLVILNTIVSAASVARELAEKCGRRNVEHMSTALAPKDRARIIKRVKKRLKNKDDTDWTLVATSCVEAGVDFSFAVGARERAGLGNLIQAGGRVNRNNLARDAVMYDLTLQYTDRLRPNKGFIDAAKVLEGLFAEEKVAAEHCTLALVRELRRSGKDCKDLLKYESSHQFHDMAEKFRVIGDDTHTVVVLPELVDKIDKGQRLSREEVQSGAVNVRNYLITQYKYKEIPQHPGLYVWRLDYDAFLGYMRGALGTLDHQDFGTIL